MRRWILACEAAGSTIPAVITNAPFGRGRIARDDGSWKGTPITFRVM